MRKRFGLMVIAVALLGLVVSSLACVDIEDWPIITPAPTMEAGKPPGVAVPPPTAQITLNVPSEAWQDGYFTVAIEIAGAVNLAAWEMELAFTGPITPTGEVACGALIEDAINVGPVVQGNTLTVGQFSRTASEYSGDGVLCSLEFQAVAQGEAVLDEVDTQLWHSDGSEQDYVVTNDPVTVVVRSPCYCDFNGDGLRDLADILMMIPAWHSNAGDPEYDPTYDLYPVGDPDGHIGLGDIMQCVAVWNTPCGDKEE